MEETPNTPPTKLETKIQLDFAWKWFEFHARQRTTMFNFFIISVGVVLNAVGILVKDGKHGLSIAVSALGLILSICFLCLDFRNRHLYEYGEIALREIETKYLDTNIVQKKHDKAYSIIRHKCIIPIIIIAMGLFFVGAICYAGYYIKSLCH